MAEYGLGNFVYEINFDGKNANFKFRDPDDVSNVAEVTVSEKEFPENAKADSRQVADYAYTQVAKTLNDKRDERLKKEAAKEVEERQEADARLRETANDFFDKSQELSDQENYHDDFQNQSDANKKSEAKKK